ncbi:MAG: hypothetical protein ACI8P2_002351 [Candidatus Latescibacterota bacterium]|jgi:hypothetical protein
MRRYVLVGLLAAGVLGACSGEDPLSAEYTEEPAAKLTLSSTAVGSSVEVPSASPVRPIEIAALALKFDQPLLVGDLTLTLKDVQDSRCPDEAVCVTAGEVKLTLGAVQNDVDLGMFELVLGAVSRGTSSLRIGDYKVGVRGVLPYPVLDEVTARESYEVALVVVRRAGNLTISKNKAGGYRGELPEVIFPGTKPPVGEKPDHSKLTVLLAENRAKWATQSVAEYTFNFSRSCFCLPDYRREAVLAISSGQISSATYVDDGAAVAVEVVRSYKTIEGLFSAIDEAITTGAAQIDVEFDADLGFPAKVFIDQDFRIADEEASYSAGKVVLVGTVP